MKLAESCWASAATHLGLLKIRGINDVEETVTLKFTIGEIGKLKRKLQISLKKKCSQLTSKISSVTSGNIFSILYLHFVGICKPVQFHELNRTIQKIKVVILQAFIMAAILDFLDHYLTSRLPSTRIIHANFQCQ